MSKFKSKKVNSYQSGDFSETLNFKVLHCGNVEGNNNKFYCLELQSNPNTSEYRLFSNYGRLGYTEIFEIRGPINEQSIAESEFDKIIKKKLKGKTIKDKDGTKRREKYVEVEVLSPNVGSSNIRKVGTITKHIKAPPIDTSQYSLEVRKLVETFIAENVHQIKTKTSFKISSTGGVETPLGPVTENHIKEAEEILKQLKILKDKNQLNFNNQEARELNTAYLSLIPHDFSRKIQKSDMILTDEKLIDEFELLENLLAAVKISSTDDSKNKLTQLGIEIDEVNKTLTQEIIDKIEQKRTHRQLDNWKPFRVFSVKNSDIAKNFNKNSKKLGNIQEVYHGTRTSNILSIIMTGFYVPPHNAPHVTGRMFGDGVYGAPTSSTKALNYSSGFWGGRSSSYPNIFLFIVDFTMGEIFYCKNALYNGCPSGYDSIFAQRGDSLINDEAIVPNPKQTNIKFLVEFKRR